MLFQTCKSFFALLNTNEDIMKNVLVTRHLTVFDFYLFPMAFPSTVWLLKFLKISSFVFNRTKRLLQFLEQHGAE